MITVLGILIGALIVGLVWTNVYFSHEIARIRGELARPNSQYRPTTYADYYSVGRLNEKLAEARKLKGDLDSKIEEGLLLLEQMDKRGIRVNYIKKEPTNKDWDNWKDSLCQDCLDKLSDEDGDEE